MSIFVKLLFLFEKVFGRPLEIKKMCLVFLLNSRAMQIIRRIVKSAIFSRPTIFLHKMDSENAVLCSSIAPSRWQPEMAVALAPPISSPSIAARPTYNADWIDADVAVDRMIRCEQVTVKVYVCSFIMQSGHECGTRSRKLKVSRIRKTIS